MKTNKPATRRSGAFRYSAAALGVAAACAAMVPAHAFKIEVDNPDFVISLDNAVRYNAAQRRSAREPELIPSAALDEGNYSFDKGELVLSRFDLFSELDVNYRDQYGFRVSAAAWYDGHFPVKSKSDPRFASAPNYANNNFTDYVNRYYRGPSAEFGDAFVWGNFGSGSTNANVKVGRFAWLPGEFVLGNGGSASFSMAPNDGRKSDLSPGASAKETALPIGQVAAIVQVNSEWSVMGQYTYEFRSSRISEGGTFFQVNDTALAAPFISNPAVPRVSSFEGEKGDISVGAKWQPTWAEGDAFGAWYRKFDDKNPTYGSQVQVNGATRLGRAVYAKDIDLLGLTYNTVLASWAVGAELNVRKNMPLLSTGTYGVGTGLINDPTLDGARGTTIHGLVSGVITLNKNPVFDSGSIAAQFDFMRLQDVTKNKDRFNGVMSGVAGRCANEEVLRNCGTRHAASVGVSFTPTWQQVFPSVDLSLPLFVTYGLKGNAAAVGAGVTPEKSYLARIGARAEYLAGAYKHQFDLTYVTRDGKKGVLPGGATTTYSGLANFRDRDYLSFTYATGF